jgi:outer membrane protein assembly factor BamB
MLFGIWRRPIGSGNLNDLKRHLVCIDATTGAQLWEKSVTATQPEDPYSRMLGEHGYASGTPVSDGERVYVFYGKSGVLAYDLDGNELWRVSVGTESGPMRWGSGASPILYGDMVIVNASEENQALFALDKKTGKEVWKAQAEGLGMTWGTPILVGEGEATELAIGVPGEIWGFNPKTGKLKWFAQGMPENSFCASLVTDGSVVYAIDGRGGEASRCEPEARTMSLRPIPSGTAKPRDVSAPRWYATDESIRHRPGQCSA